MTSRKRNVEQGTKGVAGGKEGAELSAEFTRERYHAAQADPTRDTAAKRIARRGADAIPLVYCPDCDQSFPATVQRRRAPARR
jgi:hypothetical protein